MRLLCLLLNKYLHSLLSIIVNRSKPGIVLKQCLDQAGLSELVEEMVHKLYSYLSYIKYLFPWYIYSLVSFSYLEVGYSNASFC